MLPDKTLRKKKRERENKGDKGRQQPGQHTEPLQAIQRGVISKQKQSKASSLKIPKENLTGN